MAEIPMKAKTAIVWADTTDYLSTISGLARTAQIDLTGIANGAARQGQKVDLTTLRAHEYLVFVGLELAAAAAIVAGERANIYFSQSSIVTAANANPGGVTGVDGVFAPTDPNLDAALSAIAGLKGENKFDFVFDERVTAAPPGGVQYQAIGRILTPLQFISPVIRLATASADLHTDAVEMFIALLPLLPESQ